MESPASASPSLPEGEVLADFLVFVDDAAAAEEPYEVEMEEEEEEPQEVEFAADDGSDDDVGDDLVGNGGLMEDEVNYVYDYDSEGGSFDIMADDDDEAAVQRAPHITGATTPAAEELAARVAEPPSATAGNANARMSVKPVNQFGEDYEAINEMIREYLQAEKKRRRARRVAAAMLRCASSASGGGRRRSAVHRRGRS